MNLPHRERLTLVAIHNGDLGPHRVAVLRSLVRRGLVTDRQGLTPAGLRLAVEEATRRWDAQITAMRETIREHRQRFGR